MSVKDQLQSIAKRIQSKLREIEDLRNRRSELKERQRLVAVINKHGAFGEVIYDEAQQTGLPLPLACALVEQESLFKNIFGCDWGSGVAFCHEHVSETKVKALIKGGKANGIGLTQLTSFEYVEQANALGGAWVPRNQCRVGFKLLKNFIADYGEVTGIGAYNGGAGNPQYGYASEVLARKKKWQSLLAR